MLFERPVCLTKLLVSNHKGPSPTFTSRHIRERLEAELQRNLALRVEPTDNEDKWNVFDCGILYLSVLIETARRKGYELQICKLQVLMREVDGVMTSTLSQLL